MVEDKRTEHLRLSGEHDCLLLPLLMRARETRRTDAILKDEWAVKLVDVLNLDESKFNQAQVREEVQVSILLRSKQLDQITREFLALHPGASVVHLGCGLDARFERVDNEQVKWYDLDLPEVIQLRRELMGGESCRYHLLACSALDHSWMDRVSGHQLAPILFVAEGLFMFFEENQVRQLLLTLESRFHPSQLAFDAFSPFYAWGNNRRVARTNIGSKVNWALKNPKEIESWAPGIHLINEWYPFIAGEPRLAHLRWIRLIPFLAKTTGIFHYWLE